MIVLAVRQIQLYPRTGLDQWGGSDAQSAAAKDMGNQGEAGKKQGADSHKLKMRHPQFAPQPTFYFRHIFACPRSQRRPPIGRSRRQRRRSGPGHFPGVAICAILQPFDMFLLHFGAGRGLI